MEENFSFGYWLRRQRLARDLRQAELAAQLGIAPITLRKIEADERRPSLQLIERVASVFALGEQERATLLQVARADLTPAALPLPQQPADLDAGSAPAYDPVALPSGTLTFLFTDIEASTRHWEQYPDAMREALAQHNQLLQQAIADGGGIIVKHTGDGVLAVFTRCVDAVTAAVAAQRLLAANEWGTGDRLLVRMAIHTGTVEVQGDDYVGPALNRTARLLAAGHGGQVLLSLAAAELARDQLPAGVILSDLGSHRLRDLTRPEQIFQVVADGLPSAFPPLRSLHAHHQNLPAQTTALIGREREVADLCSLLVKPDVRLVTLTGPGGTGKTRLALQAAAELVEQFRDGVWFVNLASVTDAERVVEAIAHVLGLRESGAMSLRDVLHAAIRDQQLLLILDNFEQVLDAASEVAVLLELAPQIRVIVTSRAILRVRAEHIIAVAPLSLPERQAPLTHTQLSQYDAVRLFIERSRAVRQNFEVTHANAPAIAEICWRLDGLPLAIELAAARMRLFSPEALLARLDQRLPLLTTGARDLPTRQQTLRATIEWSFALLGDAERTLFCRLAVFEGGWDPGAAAAVGKLDDLDALETLVALGDKSLIRQAESPDSEPRFTMLETIQEYALEQLQAHGEAEHVRGLHALYYLALAETSEAHMTGNQSEEWLARLDMETHNLWAAFVWYQTATDGHDSLQRLAGALWWFWYLRGYARTGRMWLETALAQASADLKTETRAKLLLGIAALIDQLGEHELARQRLEESIAYARLIDRPELLGLALTFLGLVLGHNEHYVDAVAAHTESLKLFRSAHNRWGEALATQYLGEIYWFQGQLEAAHLLFEQSAELFGRLGDQWGRARALGLLGFVAHDQGKHEQARMLLEEGIAGMQVIGDTFVLAVLFNKYGLVLRCLDDARAAAMFEESRELFLKVGSRFWAQDPIRNLGCVMLEQGDPGRAADYICQSIQLCYEAGMLGEMSVALTCLACVATQHERYQRAATLFGAASKLMQIEIALDPANRRMVDHYQIIVETHLDADEYATHWQFGQSLTIEQILAYAHDDTEGHGIPPAATLP